MSNKVAPYYITDHEAYASPLATITCYDNGDLKALNFEDKPPKPEVNQDSLLWKRRWLAITLATGSIAYGVLSVVFDWLWVDDMLNAEQSLVFGPPPVYTVALLIVIAFVGTLSFAADIVDTIEKTFYDHEMMGETLSQILSLFVEEIPQITLNVLLASCHEVPISVFQMIKAGLALLGSLVRVGRVVTLFCKVKRRKGIIECLVRLIILSACLYVFSGSVLTLVFTYIVPTDEDSLGIRLPPSVITKTHDGSRYFYKSGIYFHHPSFQECAPGDVTWVQLDQLIDFRAGSETEMAVLYSFDLNSSLLHISTRGDSTCFITQWEIDANGTTTCDITYLKANTCLEVDHPNQMKFIFKEIEPTKTLVFGDIIHKATFSSENECETVTSDTWGHLHSNGVPRGRLQYFKSKQGVNDTYNFLLGDEGVFQHYRQREHLINVTEAWLTGFSECEMTGSLSPNHDGSLPLDCN